MIRNDIQADIRNKLSPINNVLAMLEDEDFTVKGCTSLSTDLLKNEIYQSKKSIEYLSNFLVTVELQCQNIYEMEDITKFDTLYDLCFKLIQDKNFENLNRIFDYFLDKDNRGFMRILLVVSKDVKENETIKDNYIKLSDKLRSSNVNGVI